MNGSRMDKNTKEVYLLEYKTHTLISWTLHYTEHIPLFRCLSYHYDSTNVPF